MRPAAAARSAAAGPAESFKAAPALVPVPAPPAGQPGADSVQAVLAHFDEVAPAVESLRAQAAQLAGWGVELAGRL
ncbi:sugar isomerase (SIS), partial [Arthrobacter crystallopoietes BAB-32]